MVVMNGMSRYHLEQQALRRSQVDPERVAELTQALTDEIESSVTYAREHFEDPPHIRDWVWSGAGF
jgi:phosphoketolase